MAQVGVARGERIRAATGWFVLAALVVCAAVAAGYGAASLARPVATSRMLPWIAGSSLGLGAFCTLTLLMALGIWMHHPWRSRGPAISPEAALRAHAALGAATVLLVVAHLSALALDRYAGVGWVGALIPGRSAYRTPWVALGVTAFYLMLLIAATAGFAGRITGRHWLTVHRLAIPVYISVWLHGVMAGTDTAGLRTLYGASGLAVALLLTSRYVAAER